MTWIYMASWLKGRGDRLVGIEATEMRDDECDHNRDVQALFAWLSPERQADERLDAWARVTYEGALTNTAIPIRDRCANVPTIRIERAEEAATT